MNPDNEPTPGGPDRRPEELGEIVGRKAERMLRARRERHLGLWYGLGMFGLVGWSVVIPTLIGIAIGAWIDRSWPGRASWTITGLFLGVVLGCLNAWYWVRREGGRL